MTDHDDQTPTRADFRRAAALYLHRRHHDHAGVNTILADADNRQRCSALVLAKSTSPSNPPTHSPARQASQACSA